MGQTEDEESSSGYDSFDGVNSISNPTYSGPTIHSRYAAALNSSSDTKYNSEVQARPELSHYFVFFFLCKFVFFSFCEKLLRRESNSCQ